jgi:hypothetical protein
MSADLELTAAELEATAGGDVDELLDDDGDDDGRLPRSGRRRRRPPRARR